MIACKYCYCDHCKEKVVESGIDWESLLNDVKLVFDSWSTSPESFSRMER